MRPAAQTPSNHWGPLPPHARPSRSRRLWRWLERLFFAMAVVCLGYVGYVVVETTLYQAYEDREIDRILASAPASVDTALPVSAPRRPVTGSAIGRIEIPRLGVAAVVKAGTDARTLRLAVGLIPGTAYPGEAGNVGLAGHRDTFFRKLRDVRPGDEIRITTADGRFRYVVDRTHVVNPKDVWVLDQTTHPSLTLVTCYPFSYVGSAPQRFVVRATLDPARRVAAR